MSTLQTYLQHRQKWEVIFWISFLVFHWIANSTVVIMDLQGDIANWKPILWEGSSGLAIGILLPIVLWFDQRAPLEFGHLKRHATFHLMFSVAFSLTHVLIMVGIRKLVYWFQGETYEFGHWPTELFYEYLKDVRSYGALLSIIYLYRFFLFRLQGEVAVLEKEDPPPAQLDAESPRLPDRLLIKKLGREFLINVADIEWLEASGNYVNLHVNGRAYPYRGTMKRLECELDPERFLRVHRSFIVNVNQITEIEPSDSGDATIYLKTGQDIPFSRRYRNELKHQIQKTAP